MNRLFNLIGETESEPQTATAAAPLPPSSGDEQLLDAYSRTVSQVVRQISPTVGAFINGGADVKRLHAGHAARAQSP